jgi:hypothetical protein
MLRLSKHRAEALEPRLPRSNSRVSERQLGYSLEDVRDESVNVSDLELVQQLAARDGPLSDVSLPHSAGEGCRYRSLYPEGDCPWCAAVDRRRRLEAEAVAARSDSSAKD